jgi:acyl-CoA thioester hydrolase
MFAARRERAASRKHECLAAGRVPRYIAAMDEASLETYRGAVAASECDAFGHLNIAFYPGRFEAAAKDLIEQQGIRGEWRTRRIDIRYRRELRAGEGIVIRSAMRLSDAGLIVLAHDASAASGEATTTAEHRLAALQQPVPEPELAALGEGTLATGRDRIGADELVAGELRAAGFVRRFSDACLFAIEAIGMNDAYRRDANRGFATFETRLAIEAQVLAPGDGVAVTSAIAGIGNSSLRLIHVMRATAGGQVLGRFYQAGVHFDLERRRSAPWPDAIRARAATFITP